MTEKTTTPNYSDLIEATQSIKRMTPKHSKLLGETALKLARSVSFYGGRLESLKANGVSEKALNNQAKLLGRTIDEYAMNSYDVKSEVREPLAEAPDNLKKAQNNIFSFLTEKQGGGFILRVIEPRRINNKEAFIYSSKEEPYRVYDFVGKLTEKDSAGKYVVSDETVKTFISWYHNSIAGINKEIMHKMDYYIRDYKTNLEIACKNGFLPEELKKRAELLGSDKNNYEFGFLDAISSHGLGYEGLCSRYVFSKNNIISLRLDHWLKRDSRDGYAIWPSYDGLRTFNHETTHAISGDDIDFGSDEANRIVREGLTESISAIITRAARLNYYDESEYAKIMEKVWPFGGSTYEKERKVLEYLSSGGQKDIDPIKFFRAYAEIDKNYQLKRDGRVDELPFLRNVDNVYNSKEYNDFINKPFRSYGPDQQKLIDSLLKSFPECKDLIGLGKMIEDKFNEFKGR